MINFDEYYSENARGMRKSVIRELLKLTTKPEIISFAGGLPAPETFPVADLKAAADRVFEKHASAALQYGTTEGDGELKEQIIEFEGRQGVRVEKDNLLIVSASQQALDIVSKIFLNPGEYVIAGRPTYVGTIQAIQSYDGRMLGIPFSREKDGFDIESLEKTYVQAVKDGKRVKFVYVIPDFQNPSGICWSREKRQALLDFSYRHNLLVVEDSPYREIRFLGESIPSVFMLDQCGENRGNVINLKTFSKILVPGARIGWMMADETLIQKFVIAKQAMDLCTNVFAQKWLAEYMKTGKLASVIRNTCDVYRKKRNFMVEMLLKYMPSHPEISWTEPEGGLFLWITLPSYVNTDDMFYKAIEEKVAYVVGSAFYFDNPETNAMRINFSYPSLEQIEEGVKRLAKVVKGGIEAHENGEVRKVPLVMV